MAKMGNIKYIHNRIELQEMRSLKNNFKCDMKSWKLNTQSLLNIS